MTVESSDCREVVAGCAVRAHAWGSWPCVMCRGRWQMSCAVGGWAVTYWMYFLAAGHYSARKTTTNETGVQVED